MPRAPSNGIELEYDTFGEPSDPPLLLVMGLASQMIVWDEAFCERLAGRGFHVIRFDNRDVGLSTKLDGAPRLDVVAALTAALSGEPVEGAPYLLADMADDAAGLLDHLGIAAAHVVGASMGGMIAQTLAARHPSRVLTLTSIMSSTGARDVGQPHGEAIPLLVRRMPPEKEEYVLAAVAGERLLHGPVIPFDEERARERAARRFDRGYHPAGVARQLMAILASGDRTDELAGIEAPTLVLHGDQDLLVDHSGGVATAKAIPGAELRTIEGLGHTFPPECWDEIIDAVARHAERAA